MNNNEEWNEFLNNLISNEIDEHRNSKEDEYLKARQEHIDEILTTNLTADQKVMVEEILFETGLASERETEIVYRQGFKDCVWLLKNLGLVA